MRRIFHSRLLVLFLIALIVGFPFHTRAFNMPPWDAGHQNPVCDPGQENPTPGADTGACPPRQGSPFEVNSGNFIHTARDLLIPALGPDIALARTYNGLDLRNGPFGRGWTFTYDIQLIETTDEAQIFVIYRHGDAKRDRFVQNPDGTYTPPPHLFSTLVKHPDGTFTLTEKDGTQRRFNTDGRLVAVVDRNGNALSLTYDATGFLTHLTDASGRTALFTKGSTGKIDSISDPAGRVFHYDYDTQGQLIGFTDPMGGKTQYFYDTTHRLVKIVDPRGHTARQMTYDTQGRVVTYTEEEEEWTITYVPDQKKTTKRDTKNNTWTYIYDANGIITQKVDPLGNHEDLVFDASFNLMSLTDENGHTTTFTYDTSGNRLTITDALGHVTKFTYESRFNQVTSITHPLGDITLFGYDALGNLITIADALGSVYRNTYDSKGQLIATTDALSNTTRFTYDAHGCLIQIANPLGHATTFTRDVLCNVTATMDAEGRTTQFTYDLNNRRVATTDAAGGARSYSYDANGNMTSLLDANGNATSFAYDDFDRVTTTMNPLGQTKTYRYDSKGNLISTTDAKGQIISFSYDALDRLISKSMPGNTLTWSYDKVSNMVSLIDNDSNLTFMYDNINRLIQANTGATSGQPATTIVYTYDANSNRLSMTDPRGGGTTYVYDALSRLVSLTNPKGGTATYTYDRISRRISTGLPNGSDALFRYDAASQLLNLTHRASGSTIARFDYTYDRVGNRLSMNDIDGLHSYAYDVLNRLIAATHPRADNPPETFTYDPVGNRLTSHISSSYDYDDANRLQEDGQFSYTYDANGNLIEKTEKSTGKITKYIYDAENQLTRIDFPESTFASYRYDGLGRRIEKNANGLITRYVYDSEDILLEIDSAGTLVARHTHGPGVDEPLLTERGGQSFVYHTDGLGSVAELTDSTGAAVQSYVYDSFGQIVQQAGTLPNPYTYTGREFDSADLYYYRARYYNPELGRFLQEDPIHINGNVYVYANNNPINFTDPTGLATIKDALDFLSKHGLNNEVDLAKGNIKTEAGLSVKHSFKPNAYTDLHRTIIIDADYVRNASTEDLAKTISHETLHVRTWFVIDALGYVHWAYGDDFSWLESKLEGPRALAAYNKAKPGIKKELRMKRLIELRCLPQSSSGGYYKPPLP